MSISPIQQLKRIKRKTTINLRTMSSSMRLTPDFLIIGAQKGGTTSLYLNLIEHPYVLPAFTKEVNFFNANFSRGIGWYKAFFPTTAYASYYKLKHNLSASDVLTGEATPDYILHPHTPKRIAKLMPKVKLIVLLRNPVDRAYSHYWHNFRYPNIESLSFEEAIEKENERLAGEMEKMLHDPTYYSFNYNWYSYLTRGIYLAQLKNWMEYFPQEQLLILSSEDFYEKTPEIFAKVQQFLDLPEWMPEKFKKNPPDTLIQTSKLYGYPPMDGKIHAKLSDFFKPYNKQLFELLNVKFEW